MSARSPKKAEALEVRLSREARQAFMAWRQTRA